MPNSVYNVMRCAPPTISFARLAAMLLVLAFSTQAITAAGENGWRKGVEQVGRPVAVRVDSASWCAPCKVLLAYCDGRQVRRIPVPPSGQKPRAYPTVTYSDGTTDNGQRLRGATFRRDAKGRYVLEVVEWE